MANPFIQYLKDTRTELNHVAWPTQRQTIVFTILVAAISLGVAAYLGAFDYIFRTALGDALDAYGNALSALEVTQQAASTTTSQTTSQPSSQTTPSFSIPGVTTSNGSTEDSTNPTK